MLMNIFLSSVSEEDWLITTLWFICACLCYILRNVITHLPEFLARKVSNSLMLIPTKGRQGWLYTIAQISQEEEGTEVSFGE